LALAGEDKILIAANPNGVHVRTDDGRWDRLDVPGISKYSRVTSLAVNKGEICVGTDGEGLHILTGGTWEVKTARYGGLPDDSVWSLAYDGENDGMPGENLWVGTSKGIALRSMGKWSTYEPGKKWLEDLVGDKTGAAESTYIGSGYKLGGKGDIRRFFKPAVTSIGVGPDRVVFGNRTSRIAIIRPEAAATVYFLEGVEINELLVEKAVLWVGTSKGLFWGGLTGEVRGAPWPSHRNSLQWTGRLFGTRNSKPYLYRWHLVGYNTAKVPSMVLSDDALWVVYGKTGKSKLSIQSKQDDVDKKMITDPIMDVRRLVNVHEYIKRKEAFSYESYGKNAGISGEATVILSRPEGDEIWLGTAKGLYRLEK
jgi:ligand-binding sensor domain-containing protein